jgi:hypothetical protein
MEPILTEHAMLSGAILINPSLSKLRSFGAVLTTQRPYSGTSENWMAPLKSNLLQLTMTV